MRAEIQRRLAAQIDLGTPDPAPTSSSDSGPSPSASRVFAKPERPNIDSMRADVRRTSTATVQKRSMTDGFKGFRIKGSRLALVGVAVIAGGAAAFLATQHDQAAPTPTPPPVEQVVVPKMQVLVTKQPLGVGQRITADSLAWQDFPKDTVRPEYLTEGTTPDAMTTLVGSIVRTDFVAGEPVRKDKLASPDQGFLSSVLPSGMRAVSVSVTADDASGGFISPNDHVDVVLTRTTNNQSVSTTVLHNVQVLAINDKLGPGTPSATGADAASAQGFAQSAVATLELDPVQSEVAVNAFLSGGKLSLVLLSVADYAKAGGGAITPANQAIRLTSPFWTNGATLTTATSNPAPAAPQVN